MEFCLENYEVNIVDGEFSSPEYFNSYVSSKNESGNTNIELLQYGETIHKIVNRKLIAENLDEKQLISKLLELDLIKLKL